MDFEKLTKIYDEVSEVLIKHFKADKNMSLPELLFCETCYSRKQNMVKDTTLACLKTMVKYNSKLNERLMVALPIIVVYRKNINLYIKMLKLEKTEKLEENIYRIFFMHELIHYFQLKDKPPYSKYIGKNYKPFEETTNRRFMLEIEKECVFTIREIIKKYYDESDIMKKLWSLEMVDFKRLYLNDLSDDLNEITEQINSVA